MEARYCNRSHGAENLNSLQKFEELLHRKEMEIATLELEIYSSRKKPSKINKFGTEGSSEHLANACSELLTNKVPENFEGKHDTLYCKTEKERGSHRYNLEARKPMDKEKLLAFRASCSNQLAERSQVNCLKGKFCINSYEGKAGEVEQINKRLQILEEEAQTFLGSVQERKMLMKEISQQFQIIYGQLRNKSKGEESHDGTSIIKTSKDGRMEAGLSQVLCGDSNPSLIARDLRANMLAFQEPDELMHEFSHR